MAESERFCFLLRYAEFLQNSVFINRINAWIFVFAPSYVFGKMEQGDSYAFACFLQKNVKTSPIFWSSPQSVLSLQSEKMKKWKGIWKSEKSNLIF